MKRVKQILGDKLKKKIQEEIDKQDVDRSFQRITAPTIDENFVVKHIQSKFKMNSLNNETGEKKLIWHNTGEVLDVDVKTD